MKKVLGILFIGVALLLSSCATLDKALLNPLRYEIEYEIGGKVECSVLTNHYEVKVGKNITKAQAYTFTSLYLYTIGEDYYWKILRDNNETAESFFPKNIHFKVTKMESKELPEGGKMIFYMGADMVTGDVYTLMESPWSKGYGRFFVLGNKERQIIYSTEISKINWE
jgi:hypothetical protein